MSYDMPRGQPRPLKRNGMPVPYNVPGPDNLGTLDPAREQEIFLYNLCQTCGLTLDEFCYAVEGPGRWVQGHKKTVLDNGGLHEACLRLALTWCPHLRAYKKRIFYFRTDQLRREDDMIHILIIPDDAVDATDQFQEIVRV